MRFGHYRGGGIGGSNMSHHLTDWYKDSRKSAEDSKQRTEQPTRKNWQLNCLGTIILGGLLLFGGFMTYQLYGEHQRAKKFFKERDRTMTSIIDTNKDERFSVDEYSRAYPFLIAKYGIKEVNRFCNENSERFVESN